MHKIKKLLSVILCACILSGMSGCGRISSKTVNELADEGYEVEWVSDDSILITEDGAEYYFKTGLLKPELDKIVVNVPTTKEKAHEAGYTTEVTITRTGRNRMTVIFSRPVLLTDKDGEEEYGTDYYTFRFKNGFSADDMTNNRGFHDMKSDYDACFGELSSDEAQRLYDRALELEKEL